MRKKNIIILIICVVLIIFLSILGYYVFDRNRQIIINSEENNKLLEKYNSIIKNIEDNMNSIMISNEDDSIIWFYFNNEIKDTKKRSLFNNVVRDIRNSYYYSNTDIYSHSNYVDKFSGYEKVKKKDFEELMMGYNFNNDYLINFIYYKDNILDSEYEKIKMIANEIYDYYLSIKDKEFKDYKSVLENEIKKMEYIEKLTKYLVDNVE